MQRLIAILDPDPATYRESGAIIPSEMTAQALYILERLSIDYQSTDIPDGTPLYYASFEGGQRTTTHSLRTRAELIHMLGEDEDIVDKAIAHEAAVLTEEGCELTITPFVIAFVCR